MSTLFTVDNIANVKNKIPQCLPFAQLLNYSDITKDNTIGLEYSSSTGESKSIDITIGSIDKRNFVTVKPDFDKQLLAPCYKNQKSFFTEECIADSKIYYLMYNKCFSREVEMEFGDKSKANQLPSFEEFQTIVLDRLKSSPIEKFVFDLRYNQGGNSTQGTKFIGRMSSFFNDNPNVKIYVVVGRQTFSSAILNALDFKKLKNVVFIGEETAGKPNHFGEVRSLRLPSSNLEVYYSTKFFKRTDEKMNTLMPDVKIETKYSDFLKGIDPIYEYIKND